ncbi:tubulin-like doman-containing protein [Methanolobus sp. ZRKC5]|uniref:tubulin-like doman-containing protein n=1 Tax=unclassified Methanolobus TaxID=2629569 RepID=UPI00313DC349
MSYEKIIPPLQLPTDMTIVGVGGCGKRLTMEICNNDWFLKHYSGDGRRLKVYTMDADANEKEGDEERLVQLKNKIISCDAQGNIESKFFYLPSLANISQVPDLASKEIAEKVKNKRSEPKVKTWWLNDESENGISFEDLLTIDHLAMDDFGGGVHRRRAISKAIFYKVITEGESSGFPTFSSRGSVAIVVGLGGGTGSGMFIDLARYIRAFKGDSTQLCLFVVLPTTQEGEKEQLNASIALTELEYLNMTERLFNNVIVTSLGPTGYKKGEEAREEVHEFDAMFPNVFTNFFHVETGDINISDVKGAFSSFIFANSHVIEYPIEDLRGLKNQYEEIINSLEMITISRKELNQQVSSFLENQYSFNETAPTKENFEYIKKEYRNIENVLKHEIGHLLNYKSVDTIEYFLANQIPSEMQIDKISTFNDLVEYLSKLKAGSQNVKPSELTDENDKKLANLIPESIQVLEETALLFRRVSGVTEESARSTLIDMLKGNQNMSSTISNMNVKTKNLKDEIRDLEKNVMEKEEEHENAELLKSQISKKAEQRLSDNEKEIDQYLVINRKVQSLDERERDLKIKLEEFISLLKSDEVKARDKSSWLRAANVLAIQQEVKDLSHEIGDSFDGLLSLIESIALYYFYDSERKKQEKGGLVSLIKGDKKKKIRKYEAMKKEKEDYIKSNAKYWNIQINSPFEFYIPDDFLNKGLHKKAADIKNQAINSLLGDTAKDSVSYDRIDAIFDKTERSELIGSLRDSLTELYLKKEGYFLKTKAITGEIDGIKEEIGEKHSLADMMDNAEELHERTFSSRRDLNKHYESFYHFMSSINEKTKSKNKTDKSLYRTKVGEINPKILSLIGEMSDLTSLDNDDNGMNELNNLLSEVKATYPSLLENYKLGIHNQMIPISTTEKWNFGKVGLVIGSRSSYISSSVVNSTISTDINAIMSLKSAQDARVITHSHAKPWEVTLTLLAATSFLDNISPLTSGGGYWKVYEQSSNNILHHVLKMQDGQYITRKKLLDVKYAGELANSEKAGQDIVPIIKDLYEVKTLREALE